MTMNIEYLCSDFAVPYVWASGLGSVTVVAGGALPPR